MFHTITRRRTVASASRRIVAAGFVSAVLASAQWTSAGAVSPATTSVLECGSVVTHDVRLTCDLVGCAGNGLIVGADGVDIDLNGHSISGAGPFESLSGVDIDAFERVRIRGGKITDFSRGVLGYDADGVRIERLSVTRTLEAVNLGETTGGKVRDSRLAGNREGIVLRGTARTTVAGNVVVDNDTTGITDIDSRANVHARNLVARNTFDGISLESTADTAVVDNVVRGNGIDGIEAVVGTGVRYVGNRVNHNDEHGINDSGDGTVWRRNVANRNGAVGLRVDGLNHIDAGGNQARGNGEENCVGLSCR